MPADTFEREVALSSDTETCWKALTDVERLVGWIAVLGDVEEHEHLGRYSAVLTDRVGPFSLHADLAITVTGVEEGKLVALEAEGRDRQVDSRIFVEGRLLLEPAGSGSRLAVEGRYEVTGRVATFGGPMIRSKAEKILNDFVRGVAEELG